MSVETTAGLSSAEVADRVARGLVNEAPSANSRSLSDILKANIFTWFNGLIGALWVTMLLIAPVQDSLFGFIIVANTLIGVVQEWRASRTLARLAVLGEAKPVVRRDGASVEVPSAQIVIDDIVVLRTGDQLVVDGTVVESDGLEVDESLLTGEADPVHKASGDAVMSGSFVVSGSGACVATRIGRDSFAAGLTEQAKSFRLTNSELRNSVNRFIRAMSYLLVPVGVLLLISQTVRLDLPIKEALRGTIAGVVTMVPEGLVLLTSIAMAVAVIRLAERRVLVQDLPAVEVLARVDTICVDKTGTLTEPGMAVTQVIPVTLPDGEPQGWDAHELLGAIGACQANPNPTLAAISAAYADPGWIVTSTVPFSSARKWSSASFRDQGSWVLGAPEFVAPSDADVAARSTEFSDQGARVLLLARAHGEPSVDTGIGPVTPHLLIVISQSLRADAAETVRYFLEQGVAVKVISGDNPATVGAIAAQAGVPGAAHPIDARTLPEDLAELAQAMQTSSVFGRVTPLQKKAMVDALHLNGATVAMTGDGVNDVLALKSADLGIAMGSGAGATRGVAQLVLLDDHWSVMPSVVAEGRRVLGNIERVSDVFLTKSFYAVVISILTGIFAFTFPFLPRHLSLVAALTIGIPGFFLALMPNTERFRPGFFRRVLMFAVPAGVISAMTALATYSAVRALGEPVANAQAAATTALFVVTLAVLLESARPLNLLRIGIVVLMAIMFVGVLVIPWFREVFALNLGAELYAVIAVAIGLVGAFLVWLTTLVIHRWR